jgi:peptide/nickel transport system substrate-binding protein
VQAETGRRRRGIAAALGLCVLAACTRIGTQTPGAAGLHPWTTPDTLRIGLYEEPDTLNPVVSEEAFASDAFQLIYDGLIRYDDRGRPIPDLALEIPSKRNGGISPDGKTLVYHLARNVRWHDGVRFTSADVAFTWRAIMNPANNSPTRDGYDRIASIETPDAYTVRLRLREPYAPALYLFRDLGDGSIVPAHLLAKYHDINRVAFNAQPVGTGPYVFRSWEHGNEMHFEANRSYFGGAPKIPHVVFKFIHDQNTLLSQLETHEIDLYYGVPPYQFALAKNVPGTAIAQTASADWEHLAFNTRRPPLDERAVRLALCSALDHTAIYRDIYHGLGTQFPVHFVPDLPWADHSIAYYPFDPRHASQLLEAAGWKLGPDGYRYRDGKQLAFSISTVAGVKPREALEVLLQSMWHAVGANVSVKNYPAPQLFEPYGAGGALDTGKTDVSLFTWDNNTPDPDDQTYIGPDRSPPAGQNVSFYVNRDVGTWEVAAARSYDPAVRRALYVRVQHALIDDVPEYVLDWLPEIDAYNVDLHGVRPVPIGSDLWNIASWSLGP